MLAVRNFLSQNYLFTRQTAWHFFFAKKGITFKRLLEYIVDGITNVHGIL